MPTVVGVSPAQGQFTVQYGVSNWYGLPLLSVMFAQYCATNPSFSTNILLYPGDSVPYDNVTYLFPNFQQPDLQTVGHYFTGYPDPAWSLAGPAGPMPGQPGFASGNPQPLLIASLGEPYQVVGYAVQQIVNGDHSKPAYLGQYFDEAMLIATNNIVTTEQAGGLSAYGNFFPTQPGPAALVTMADPMTGQQGTGVVQVISLCTDANHDGVIDPTYFGPDFTSPDRPFGFWVNDTVDIAEDQGTGIPGQGGIGLFLYQARGSIGSRRALVNFFPVHVNIQSLLKSLPSLSSLTFMLKHEGSAPLYYLETDLTPEHYRDVLISTNFLDSLTSRMGFGFSIADDNEIGALMGIDLYPRIAPDGLSVDLELLPSPVSPDTAIHSLLKQAAGPTSLQPR